MYTYAFLRLPDVSLDLPEGMMGSLQLITVNHLVALVEPNIDFELLQQRDEQLMGAILSHDRTLREVFEQTDILPLRFGTRFTSQEALLEHLNLKQTEYLEKLAYVAGKAEHTLKLIPHVLPETEISAAVKGKDYFLEKKRRLQQQGDYHHQQCLELEQLQTAIAQVYPSLLGEPQEAVERIYLLSDRQEAKYLLQQFQQWQMMAPRWELVLGEALPPYHFV